MFLSKALTESTNLQGNETCFFVIIGKSEFLGSKIK